MHGTLRGALLAFGGQLDGWGVSTADLERSAPARPYVPVLQALPLIANGELAAARELLAGFAADDIAGTHDLEPLALLASVFAPTGPDEQRERIYERLAPHAGLHVVVGGCASYWGAVDHHLGLLAAGLGDARAATRHLESARSAYQRLGAMAWADQCTAALDRLPAAARPGSPGSASTGRPGS